MALRGRLSANPWFRIWMPYVLYSLDMPGHIYLPVNRNYKPLGLSTKEWIDYEQLADRGITFVSDPFTFKNVWVGTDLKMGALVLYDDGDESQSTYFKRLDRLMNYKLRGQS